MGCGFCLEQNEVPYWYRIRVQDKILRMKTGREVIVHTRGDKCFRILREHAKCASCRESKLERRDHFHVRSPTFKNKNMAIFAQRSRACNLIMVCESKSQRPKDSQQVSLD